MVKRIFFCLALLISCYCGYGQFSNGYAESVKKAMGFYEAKQYKEAGHAFTRAFASNDGKGAMEDRYNAACAWAMAGNKDSAFFNLNRIAIKANFKGYNHLITDPDLQGLHNDKRWKPLCDLTLSNKEKAEINFNKPVVAILDTVFQDDQEGRAQLMDVEQKYGYNSKESRNLWTKINDKDSIDLIKVEKILDKYGWLGPDVVGDEGNSTLFLVIQHSDLAVQKKYLPLMREAVKNKNASPADLALLEDRVALREGKKQIYGSQIHGDPNGLFWVSPLEDPDHVDQRRAKVGLQPMADYVRQWNMKWNVEEYKKQLPEIEKKERGY